MFKKLIYLGGCVFVSGDPAFMASAQTQLIKSAEVLLRHPTSYFEGEVYFGRTNWISPLSSSPCVTRKTPPCSLTIDIPM